MVPIDINMRLIDMTQGDLIELLQKAFADTCKEMYVTIDSRMNPTQKVEYQPPLYGIKGIAHALGVSTATAQRMKNNGWLEGGYKQIGKTIVIEDSAKLREIAAEATKREKERDKGKGNRVTYSLLRKHA